MYACEKEDPFDEDTLLVLLLAGQQVYLLLGPTPLLECHYCKQPLDLSLYALARVLTGYAVQLFAVGLLTCSPVSLDRIDRIFAPLWGPLPAEASRAPVGTRLNSRHWRGPATAILSMLVSFESAVVFGLLGWDERQTSWWNHVSWQFQSVGR